MNPIIEQKITKKTMVDCTIGNFDARNYRTMCVIAESHILYE